MAEVGLNPKPLSNFTLAVTHFSGIKNALLAMNLINNCWYHLCIGLVMNLITALWRKAVANSAFKAFTGHCPTMVINRALVNIAI